MTTTTLRVGMSVTLHPIDGPVLKGEIIELGAPGHWETCAKVRIRRRDGRWRKRPEWWPLDQVSEAW